MWFRLGCLDDDVTYVYDDVTHVYDDVTHVYDDEGVGLECGLD